MPTLPPLDPALCPLCGQGNQCAVAAGQPAENCWCMRTPVSRDALARLPTEARGQACICPHCAQPLPTEAQPPSPG